MKESKLIISIDALKIAFNGINWLSRIINDNGKFLYAYYPNNFRKLKKYNVLRHAGCVWALFYFLNNTDFHIFNRIQNDKIGEKTFYLHDNIEFIRDRAIRALRYLYTKFILNSPVNIFAPVERGYIKTGAIGLSILAYLEAHKYLSDPSHLEIAEKLGGALLNLQEDSGKLSWHKFNTSSLTKDSFKSDFYDGECALALLKLYQKKEEVPEILISAEALIDWKLGHKELENQFTRDHWMLQAIELNNKIRDDLIGDQKIFSNRITKRINQIAKRIMEDPYNPNEHDIFGSIACRSEALLSYLEIFRNNPSEAIYTKDQVLDKLQEYLSFQASGQLQSGLSKGAWIRNRKSNLIRCDFAQHNIMAFLRYTKFIEEGGHL